MQQPIVEALLELLHRMAQRRPGDAEPRRGGTKLNSSPTATKAARSASSERFYDAFSRQPSTAEEVAPLK